MEGEDTKERKGMSEKASSRGERQRAIQNSDFRLFHCCLNTKQQQPHCFEQKPTSTRQLTVLTYSDREVEYGGFLPLI